MSEQVDQLKRERAGILPDFAASNFWADCPREERRASSLQEEIAREKRTVDKLSRDMESSIQWATKQTALISKCEDEGEDDRFCWEANLRGLQQQYSYNIFLASVLVLHGWVECDHSG